MYKCKYIVLIYNGKNLKEWRKTTVETDSKVHGLCSHISEYTGVEPRDGLLVRERERESELRHMEVVYSGIHVFWRVFHKESVFRVDWQSPCNVQYHTPITEK